MAPDLKYLKDFVVGDLDNVLWVIMGTITGLLLIALINVANLELVRTEARSHELAIKAALGARWSTIAASSLLESTIVSVSGGAMGFCMAALLLPGVLSIAAEHLPSALDIDIDITVTLFALGLSLASGLLFGLVSAIKYAGASVGSLLAGTSRTQSAGIHRQRTRKSLIIVQTALALILLVASGLMLRTVQSLRQVDPGFSEPDQIQTVRISFPGSAFPDFREATRLMNTIEDRLADIGEVEAVGFGSRVPLGGQGPSSGFRLRGRPSERGLLSQQEFRYISPNFLGALGTPLLAGRAFDWADHYEARPVALVSESMAQREWGSATDALGQGVRMSEAEPWREVVGVVGDVHLENLDRAPPDTIYLTLGEQLAQYQSRTVTYAIRSERVNTAGFIQDIQDAIWSVDGSLPLASVQTMGALYASAMARTSLTVLLLSITATMALLLGWIGIYGVISYLLSTRAREIAVRLALGARIGDLKRMLIGQVLGLAVVGVLFGSAGAVALTRLMRSLLFGVSAIDPATYISVSGLLLLTALVAGYLPARRVTRIDAMQALRDG